MKGLTEDLGKTYNASQIFWKKKKKPSELKDVICAVIQLTVREIRPKTPTFDLVFCCPRNQCMFQLEPKYNTV